MDDSNWFVFFLCLTDCRSDSSLPHHLFLQTTQTTHLFEPSFTSFFGCFYRIQYIWTGIRSLKMATARQLCLCLSRRLNARVLYPLRPRLCRGSSGEANTNFCSPVSDTAWDWGTCGGSRTSVIVMEEVSSLQECSLPSEVSKLLSTEAYVCIDMLHPLGQEALNLPLGVCCL